GLPVCGLATYRFEDGSWKHEFTGKVETPAGAMNGKDYQNSAVIGRATRCPQIVASPNGIRVVASDGWEHGDYDVALSIYSPGKLDGAPIAGSSRYEARPS